MVMAERDKEEMELEITKMEFDFKGTSVICRSGSPLILADLKKVLLCNAQTFWCSYFILSVKKFSPSEINNSNICSPFTWSTKPRISIYYQQVKSSWPLVKKNIWLHY